MPGVSTAEEFAAYDPWESVRVEWDVTARDEDKFQVIALLSQLLWHAHLRHCSEGLCPLQPMFTTRFD